MTTDANKQQYADMLFLGWDEENGGYTAHNRESGELIATAPALKELFQMCRDEGYTKAPIHFTVPFMNAMYDWIVRYRPVRTFVAELWNGEGQEPDKPPIGFRPN